MSNKNALTIGSAICLSSVIFSQMSYRVIAFIVGLLFIIVGGLVKEVHEEEEIINVTIPEQDVEIIKPIEVVNG